MVKLIVWSIVIVLAGAAGALTYFGLQQSTDGETAVEALGQAEAPEATDMLWRAADWSDPTARILALRFLAWRKDPRAGPRLEKLCVDAKVAEDAINAALPLAALDDVKALSLFHAALAKNTAPTNRPTYDRFADALAKSKQTGLAGALLEVVQSDRPVDRDRVAYWISMTGDTRAIRVLQGVMKRFNIADGEYSGVPAAIRRLEEIAGHAAPATAPAGARPDKPKAKEDKP